MTPIEQWNVRELFDSITDAVYTLDRQWRITYANRQALEFFGRSREELEGVHFPDLFRGFPEQPLVKAVERVMANGGSERIEARSGVRPGRWLELRAYSFAHGVAVYLLDITERRVAEERAHATLAQLQLITDSVPALIAYVDTEHRYRFNNRAYLEWFGSLASDATGRHVREVVGEAAYAQIRPLIERALAGETVAYDTVVPFSSGARHATATYVPDRADDGTVRGIVAIALDVTERRRAELRGDEYNRRLAESEERYRTFIEQSSEGIWRFEFDGPIDITEPPDEQIAKIYERGYLAECNDAFARMYGYDRADEISGARIVDFLIPDDPRNIAYLRAAIDSGYRLTEAESVETDRDGNIRYYLNNLLGFMQDERLLRVWGTQRDITDQKRIEDEREHLFAAERAARAEAETANRVKDEFLSTLSHELRTPLNAILGWAHLLRTEEELAPEVRQGLEVIERNARSQTRIVEDLLDMSRIVTGKVRLDIQRVDMGNVVERALETVAPAAEAKGLRLRSTIDAAAGAITGDPSRLQQVVWNLLSNAVKFTPAGGTVHVTLARDSTSITLTVSDSGAGIRPEFLPHIFERFRQADSSSTRTHGGLGLGLAIVKQLVELHGGSVRAMSQGEGSGATFTVTLPVMTMGSDAPIRPPARPSSVHGLESDPSAIAGIRVLVVDDEPDARELIRRVFVDCGAIVETAGSSAEALEKLRESVPDVLISDIGMPGEDGYALIAKVRALTVEEGGEVPAIALTAFARSEDRRRAMLAGYQMHVAKPVEPSELITIVASLTGRLKLR